MTDNASLINIGELSKPATVLIEKISDAIGGIFQPWQIRRVAQAEIEAEKIRAAAQIEINELKIRALQRFVAEEAIKQANIEAITAKALPQINEDAQPQNIENDWLTNFFDKSRLISDQDMQLLWAKVLAGEANSPGSYSKRTVNFLGSLDKADALLFQSLCRFCWKIAKNDAAPIIYDVEAEIYTKHNISFTTLLHLDEIGLLTFANDIDYATVHLPKKIRVYYFEKPIEIQFEKENENKLTIGHAVLSKVGQELVPICGSQAIPEFFNYVIQNWTLVKGMNVSSPVRVVGKSNSA